MFSAIGAAETVLLFIFHECCIVRAQGCGQIVQAWTEMQYIVWGPQTRHMRQQFLIPLYTVMVMPLVFVYFRLAFEVAL